MSAKGNFNRLILTILLCLLHPALWLHAEKDDKLTGIVIGTDDYYDPVRDCVSLTTNTREEAFDGDLSTYVCTYQKSHTWVGLDLGAPHVITRVGWSPGYNGSGAKGVVLGIFEGSNREDFMDALPLYMVTTEGTAGVVSHADVDVSRGFRYVRWCGPADSRCCVAELEFYGHMDPGNDSRFYQLSNLPTLSYHTYSGREPYDKVHELESEMCLIYDGGTRLQEYPVLVRERGNGSRDNSFLKRPYRVKFNDGKSHHMLKDSPLESPAKAKKWTLVPNWRDKSLIRNNIAFEMSRRLGIYYTPWSQHVDVIVNGEYKGNYLLCDQITVDPCRVPITELEPEDDEDEEAITGGYLLEITNPGVEQSRFSSSHGIPVDIKSPDADEITSLQLAYIRNTFNEMEKRLWSSTYTDPVEGYRSRLDVESFLRLLLVGEFTGNTDALWSVYAYKERGDDLFHFGPVWDFDLCMDNDQRVYPANGKTDWLFNFGSAVSGMRDFVNRILSDPFATGTLADIWADMRSSKAFSQESLCAFVDSLALVLEESQRLNFTRWDNLGQLLSLQVFAPGSYQGELDLVKTFLKNRIQWIDDKLGYIDIQDIDPNDTLFVITSPRDLLIFQHAVNAQGLTHLNARLDANLNLSALASRLQPIGTAHNPYAGTFDGRNHILSQLAIAREEDNVGLFGTLAAGAVVRGITLDETCTIHGTNSVGLVGTVQGEGTVTLQALANEGTVTASGSRAAGILGTCSDEATSLDISYCYASGNIGGEKECAAICGWAGQDARIDRCYSTATVEGVTGSESFARRSGGAVAHCYSNHSITQVGVIRVTNSSDGRLCYRLNDHSTPVAKPFYYQTLGRDKHPVLQHHLEVIRKDGTYANDLEFRISTSEDLIDFAELVNTSMPDAQALVTANLNMKGLTLSPIGNTATPYVGSFDGGGHTISNLKIESGNNYAGLFGVVGGGVVIKNLVLDSTCSISGSAYVGLIGGSNGSGTITMECLGNEGAVTAMNQNAGGIFGCNMSSAATPIFRNCYVTGPVKGGRESGQISGWAAKAKAYNCYAIGSIEGYYYEDMRDAMLRGNTQTSNCYSSVPASNAELITEEQVASGELCYLLNQDSQSNPVWYQTLGHDAHPVLDATHSVVELASDGTFFNEGNHLHGIPLPATGYDAYSIMGTRIDKSQQGIHIIRSHDGKTFKILVK
ncbi:MAG: CotH kinase family protein [Bacteroidaceae bacterium]|nr:CotH kinase family protein [Bacteroidaceae bacterium]